jgi:transposase-like protein
MITGHPVLPIGPSPTNEIAFKSRLWRREGRGFEFVEVELLGRYSKQIDQGDRIAKILGMVPADPVGGVPRTKKQVQKRLAAGELEAFSTAYRAGSSIRELAQFFKINRTTVHAHVDALGLPRRYPRLTPADVKEAAEMYQAGRSLIAIGGHFGVASDTVALALRRAGVAIRSKRVGATRTMTRYRNR